MPMREPTRRICCAASPRPDPLHGEMISEFDEDIAKYARI